MCYGFGGWNESSSGVQPNSPTGIGTICTDAYRLASTVAVPGKLVLPGARSIPRSLGDDGVFQQVWLGPAHPETTLSREPLLLPV